MGKKKLFYIGLACSAMLAAAGCTGCGNASRKDLDADAESLVAFEPTEEAKKAAAEKYLISGDGGDGEEDGKLSILDRLDEDGQDGQDCQDEGNGEGDVQDGSVPDMGSPDIHDGDVSGEGPGGQGIQPEQPEQPGKQDSPGAAGRRGGFV